MVQVYLPIQINIWIIFRYSNHMCTWPDKHQGKYLGLSKDCYAVTTQLEPTFCNSSSFVRPFLIPNRIWKKTPILAFGQKKKEHQESFKTLHAIVPKTRSFFLFSLFPVALSMHIQSSSNKSFTLPVKIKKWKYLFIFNKFIKLN